MKIFNFCTLFCLVVFYSCFSQKLSTQKQGCIRKLHSAIKENWKLSEAKDYFIINKSFLNELDFSYKKCIITFNKSDIIKLFGEPTRIKDLQNPKSLQAKYSLEYLITPPCSDIPNRETSCSFYLFLLDSLNNVCKSGQMDYPISPIQE